MQTSLASIVLQVLLSGVVGIAAAIVTTQLALTRFYRERLWEAKLKAYLSIIEAIHDIRRDLWACQEAIEKSYDTSSEYYEEMWRKHRAAWSEITKDMAFEDFLISASANRILVDMNVKWDVIGPWEERETSSALERRIELTTAALSKMRDAARQDLGLSENSGFSQNAWAMEIGGEP